MSTHRLSCLLYVSTASRIFSEADMRALLETSRDRNVEKDITGLLVYGNGHFLQVLEGDRDRVAETYGRICDDDRHHNVTRMLEEPIESRFFHDWSMAFRLYPSSQLPENAALRAALGGNGGGTMEMVRELLRIFQAGMAGGREATA